MANQRRWDATTLGRDGKRVDDSDPAAPEMGVSGSVRTLVLDPDRYAIGEVLGEGGMGEVRRCRDTSTGRDVALKAIRAHVDVDDVEVRFLREARVQARLAHPTIVPIYDVGRDTHGRAYFTMKRVEGVTLDDVIQLLREDLEAPSSQTGAAIRDYGVHRLLTAFSRVCLAVDYAHARGVLHRDLKPANIMLGAFGEVYVLDWGLAKIGPGEESYAGPRQKTAPPPASSNSNNKKTNDTQRGIAMGTPAYMAPEQASAQTLDGRADVFSLGAILFEMLALEQLLQEEDILAARSRQPVRFDPRPSTRQPRLEIPSELDAICIRATAPDPANRFPSARALHEAVEAFLAADEDQARRQRLAATHVRHARALSTREAGDARRPEALEQLGAALALAPEDVEARKALVHLLKHPPKEIPQEVTERRLQHEVARLRRMQRVSAAIHASCWLIGYPLIAYLGGIQKLGPALLVPALWILTSIVSLMLYRFRTFDSRVSWSAIASAVALGATSTIWGPLFVGPGLAVALVFGHILVATRRQRTQIVMLMCFGIAIPTLLAFFRVLDVYTPIGVNDGFTIHGAIGSARNVFFFGMLSCHLGQLIFGARFASRYRDILDARVLENALFSWQLANLVPRVGAAAAAAPPPSSGRRSALTDDTDLDVELGRASAAEPTLPIPSDSDANILEKHRYTRMQRLTETSAATVWLCHDRRFGREVEMHISKMASNDESIRVQARVRGRLEHPAVAPLYDVGLTATEGRAYFTAKHTRGVTLEQALETLGRGRNVAQRERARRKLLAAFGQVCLAIAYAHERNVCHGAVSTKSIVLGSFGEVYIDGWAQTSIKQTSATADIAALGAALRTLLDAHAHGGNNIATPELDAVCERIQQLGIAGPDACAINAAIEAFLSGDRDAEVRRELAHTHLLRARMAAESAFGGRESYEAESKARVDALREVGRAVRLEPESPEAIRLLFRLLTEPPSHPPPAVLDEVERLRTERARGSAVATAFFGAFWLLLYPVVTVLVGVRHPIMLVTVWLFWAAAEVAIILALLKKKGAPPTTIPWPMIATMLAAMATAALSGPFFVAPVIATIAGMSFALVVNRSWRAPTLILGALVNIVPTMLAWTRAFPTMDMVDNVLVADSAVVSPPHETTYLLLTVVHLLAVLFAAEFAARFRERLDAVETGFLVRTWQLTKLLPQTQTSATTNIHPVAKTTTSRLRRRRAA